MKNKFLWIVLLIIIIIIVCIFYFMNKKNTVSNNISNENTSNYSSNKVSTTDNSKETKTIEEELSTFSTKIYNSYDTARQNNMMITCSTLNNTIVEPGSTFSFCDTVGKSTSEKGYQEADIFDKDGNKKKGLGGGNCQVSSTLYNAVLNVPELVVLERHEHSNKVPYIEPGRDAAVAYGSYDFKFRNDSGYKIRIKTSIDNTSVTITLNRIRTTY